MKYFKLILAFVTLTLTSCRKDILKGEGAVSSEIVSVAGFSKVMVRGATDVHIVKGNTFSVEKKGYANLLPYLATEVKVHTLEIGFNDVSVVRNDNTAVFITMPALAGISINGNSTFNISGDFTAPLMEISVNGNGKVTITDGAAEELKTTVNGNGEIKTFGYTATTGRHTINGNGTIETTVTRQLFVNINGNGTIYYKGNPTTVSSEIAGSGKLIKL